MKSWYKALLIHLTTIDVRNMCDKIEFLDNEFARISIIHFCLIAFVDI
jgi:hypothetical protein